MEKIMNVWIEWERNWDNAYKFFNSEGNVKTKSKLKNKWHKEFIDTFKRIEENLTKYNSSSKKNCLDMINDLFNKGIISANQVNQMEKILCSPS